MSSFNMINGWYANSRQNETEFSEEELDYMYKESKKELSELEDLLDEYNRHVGKMAQSIGEIQTQKDHHLSIIKKIENRREKNNKAACC